MAYSNRLNKIASFLRNTTHEIPSCEDDEIETQSCRDNIRNTIHEIPSCGDDETQTQFCRDNITSTIHEIPSSRDETPVNIDPILVITYVEYSRDQLLIKRYV